MLSEIERFVNWTRRRSPEARTWKDYGYDLRFFMEVVGDRPLKDITFKDIDQFIAVQSEKGFKPSTINRRLASVISLYGFLAAEDEELVCPVIIRRHHLREPQRLPRPVAEPRMIENGLNLPLRSAFGRVAKANYPKQDFALCMLTTAIPGESIGARVRPILAALRRSCASNQ